MKLKSSLVSFSYTLMVIIFILLFSCEKENDNIEEETIKDIEIKSKVENLSVPDSVIERLQRNVSEFVNDESISIQTANLPSKLKSTAESGSSNSVLIFEVTQSGYEYSAVGKLQNYNPYYGISYILYLIYPNGSFEMIDDGYVSGMPYEAFTIDNPPSGGYYTLYMVYQELYWVFATCCEDGDCWDCSHWEYSPVYGIYSNSLYLPHINVPPPPLSVNISGPGKVLCEGCGTWTANAAHGNGNYSYSWNYKITRRNYPDYYGTSTHNPLTLCFGGDDLGLELEVTVVSGNEQAQDNHVAVHYCFQ